MSDYVDTTAYFHNKAQLLAVLERNHYALPHENDAFMTVEWLRRVFCGDAYCMKLEHV